MTPRRRRVVLATSSALLSLVVCFAVFQAVRVRPQAATVLPAASSVLRTGSAAPLSFELTRLGGGSQVALASLVKGRPAVLNFFASWCTACAAELDAFGQVSRQYGDSVRFVGIDTNDTDHGLALQLLKKGGIGYPVGIDTATSSVETAFGAVGLPSTFFLDRSGHVVAEVLGAESAAVLRGHIAALERAGSG